MIPKHLRTIAALAYTNGVPRVIEFAFGIHREATAGSGPDRNFITGVNWSPGINNPFRSIGKSGDGLDAILENVRASPSAPVIGCLHFACPRVAYTDRGKSAIVVEGEGGVTMAKNKNMATDIVMSSARGRSDGRGKRNPRNATPA